MELVSEAAAGYTWRLSCLSSLAAELSRLRCSVGFRILPREMETDFYLKIMLFNNENKQWIIIIFLKKTVNKASETQMDVLQSRSADLSISRVLKKGHKYDRKYPWHDDRLSAVLHVSSTQLGAMSESQGMSLSTILTYRNIILYGHGILNELSFRLLIFSPSNISFIPMPSIVRALRHVLDREPLF